LETTYPDSKKREFYKPRPGKCAITISPNAASGNHEGDAISTPCLGDVHSGVGPQSV
jgi:hypothetical protein